MKKQDAEQEAEATLRAAVEAAHGLTKDLNLFLYGKPALDSMIAVCILRRGIELDNPGITDEVEELIDDLIGAGEFTIQASEIPEQMSFDPDVLNGKKFN